MLLNVFQNLSLPVLIQFQLIKTHLPSKSVPDGFASPPSSFRRLSIANTEGGSEHRIIKLVGNNPMGLWVHPLREQAVQVIECCMSVLCKVWALSIPPPPLGEIHHSVC